MKRFVPILMLIGLLAGCGGNETVVPDEQQRLRAAREKKEQSELLARMTATIGKFRDDVGRLPTNLSEIVTFGYLQKIPEPPDGMVYYFDPVFGNVRIVPRPVEGAVSIPDEMDYNRSLRSAPLQLPSPE